MLPNTKNPPTNSLQRLKVPNKKHIIPLLLQYKKHPSLWNPNNAKYKSHENRTRVLNKILNELRLNLTVDQVRLRLKYLRTTYVREINRIISSKKNGGVPYKPRLAWFGLADSFLRRVITPRVYETEDLKSIFEEAEKGTDDNRADDVDDAEQNNSCTDTEIISIPEEIDTDKIKKEVDTDPFAEECAEDEVASNREENQNNVSHHDQSLGPNGNSSRVRRRFSAEDEFDTFGRHVANQLRSLPVREAVKSQNYIHNFLSEMRLKFLDENSS